MNADPAKAHVAADLVHGSPLIACRFDPSGRFVFAGAQDSLIVRWDLETKKKTELSGHESWPRALAFSPAISRGGLAPGSPSPAVGGGALPPGSPSNPGNSEPGASPPRLISGDYAGRLLWWKTDDETPAPQRTLDAHHGWVRGVAVSPDGQFAASCGNDLLVKLWRVDDGSLVRTYPGHTSHVYNVAFHPSGARLASCDLKGELIDWEVESGKEVRRLKAAALHKYDPTFKADIGGARGLSFSHDGRFLAAAGIGNVSNAFAGVGDPLVVVWDWESESEPKTHKSKANLRGAAWNVAIHPQGFTVALSGGGGGGHLLFWKPGEEQEFHSFKLPNTARDMDLHPDGLRLATAHADGH
jgi:WD40 repeat protein